MPNQIDIFEADKEGLKKLRDIARDVNLAQARIKGLEDALKTENEALRHLLYERMPEVMDEVGLSEFALDDGTKFTLENGVSGSFPKDPERNEKAIDWLEAHDCDGILKTELKAIFPRGEFHIARDIANRISNQCDPTIASTVHPSTLKKFARDRMAEGEPLDFEALGLSTYRRVKVK